MTNKSFDREILPDAIQFSKEKDYWINKLSGDFEVSRFPFDYYKTGRNGDKGGAPELNNAYVRFQLERTLFSKLVKISQSSDSRLFVLLVTVLMLLLQKYTGHEDIIIGAPIDKQDIGGDYINTILALRSQVPPDMTIKEFLFQVRHTIVEGCENQNYPLETIPYELNMPVGKNADFPLFDLAILLQNIHDKNYISHLKLNMIFSFSRTGERLEGEVEYNPFLYKKESIQRIIGHLIHLLHKAFDNPGAQITDLEILSEKEKEHLLIEMNNTKAEYHAESTIHKLFEMKVEKNPGNIAVEEADTGRFTSYKRLNESANQLSALLREREPARGMIMAIMGERTLEIVIGMLAILKTGGIYLPIDAQNPDERLKFMLYDSGAHIFLSQKHIIEQRPEVFQEFSPGKVIALDYKDNYKGKTKNLGVEIRSTEPAYIIYTSGTTGKPKGVMVPHKSLVNYINFAVKNYVKDEPINFPLYSSIGFDLTVTSIFTPLVTGNTIVIYSGWRKGNLMEKIVDDNKVEVVKLTPSHLYLLKEKKIGKKVSGIKRFIVGGETLNSQLARDIHDNFKGNIEIYNEYGPTEATVGCLLYEYNPQKDNRRTLAIGVPADNTQIYLLDKNLKPVPEGAIGELYVSGIGVAMGYLNRPELTAEKFIQPQIYTDLHRFTRELRAPQSPTHSLTHLPIYQTGDLGRWLSDGNIDFLGRIDQQVKIRGFRVELGEIENKLLKYDDIKEAVVIAREDHNGNKYLCSYIVLSQGSPYHIPDSVSLLNIHGLKEYLSKELPDYMIPSYFVQLEKIPLNSNGKIDRKALPDPRGIDADNNEEYIPPGNIIEKELIELWQIVLGRNDISINHNFFMIGGDSIKSIQIMARMSSAGYKIEMRDLFQYPTISELAQRVKISDHIPDQNIITGTIPLTPIQKDFFKLSTIDRHHYNQSVMLYSREEFDTEATKSVFLKIQEHHDMLRLTIKEEAGEIIQTLHGLDYPLSLEEFDFRDRENTAVMLETTANQIQAGINLAAGPMMKLGLFHLQDGDRLLIVIHHMAIDGISWRILFEDIETLYQQYKNGEKMELPLKTDSFKLWAEKLVEYANSKVFLKEKTYWAKLEGTQVSQLKKDFEEEDNLKKNRVNLSFRLSEEETDLLLTKVNEAFGTEINDILLTAFGLAIKRDFNNERVLIALEAHGREQFLEGVDINRTLGWFTCIYPAILDLSYHNNIDRQIKEIKENLHQVPNKGVGYGLLRYLTKKEYKKELTLERKPQISFNYLGQFDTDLGEVSFKIAKESPGNTSSSDREGEYELDVSGMITGNQLVISVAYNKRQYKSETIETLLEHYKEELTRLISHCSSREERELTPSDLTYKELSLNDIEEIESSLDV
jgi:iturin family lipopeptide synthetase C